MANIPTIDDSSVAPEVGPTPNVTLDVRRTPVQSGFAAAATAAGDLAGTLVQRIEKEKKEADAAAVTDAETQLKTAGNAGLYDPNNGLANTIGEQSIPAAQSFYTGINDTRQKIAAGLKDDEQRRLFLLRSGGIVEDFHRTGEVHVSQQIQVAKQATLQAGQSASLDSIAANPTDTDSLERNIASMEGPLRALSPSVAAANEQVQQWRGRAYGTALNVLIDKGDYDNAEKLFARPDVKDALGARLPLVERTMQNLGAQREGVTTATDIVNGARAPDTGFVDEAKVQDALTQIPPGPKQKIAEAEVVRQLSLAKQAETQKKNQVLSSALTGYQLAGNSISGIDPGNKSWLQLHYPEGWEKIEEYARNDMGRVANAPPTSDQQRATTKYLVDMAQHPEKYRGMDANAFYAEVAPQVGTKNYKLLEEKFGAVNKESHDVPNTDPDRIVTEESKAAFGEPKNNAEAWSPEHQAAWNYTREQVRAQNQAYAKEHNGKSAPLTTIQEWTQKALVKGTVQGTGFMFDDTATAAEAATNPKYKGKTFVQEGGSAPSGGGTSDGGTARAPEAVPKQAQSPKQVRGWKYTSDRSKRRPVFVDGTQGDPESVNGDGGR